MKLTSEEIITAVENFQLLVQKMRTGDQSDFELLVDVFFKCLMENNVTGIKGILRLETAMFTRKNAELFFTIFFEKMERMSPVERIAIDASFKKYVEERHEENIDFDIDFDVYESFQEHQKES